MPSTSCHRRALLAVALFIGLVGAADACSIPVFRYALEQWRPDPFEVLVFHRGELNDEQQTLLQRLTPEYVPGEPLPNVAVSRVDLDGEVRAEFQAIWESEPGESLPWIVVRTPWRGENWSVWQGPLGDASIETILSSPFRSELVKRLAGGESIVWLLVEGEDAAENDRLAALCTEQLQALQGGIQLPEILPEDLRALSVQPDQLGLRFSVLRLKRDDPQEQLLVRTLLNAQPGLDAPELAAEPMLFPIFGRCRAYYPLVGSAIEPVNLEDLARFLSGACQCTIKQQNPGVDLLTNVDWDAYVLGIETEKPLPPLAGLGGFVKTDSPPAASTEAATADEGQPGIEPAGPSAPTEAAVAPQEETASPVPVEQGPGTSPPTSEPRPTPANDGASTAHESDSASAAIGSQVFWVVGLLAGAVVLASLWLLPRRAG